MTELAYLHDVWEDELTSMPHYGITWIDGIEVYRGKADPDGMEFDVGGRSFLTAREAAERIGEELRKESHATGR